MAKQAWQDDTRQNAQAAATGRQAPHPGASATSTPWWARAVIYQLYVRSFSDADGDGVGDFRGATSHIDYLASLGIDAIWLGPCYPSPQVDHGYDIADYCDIEPQYGGLAAFEAFVQAAHAAGIKVLMDMVPNHCSSAHPWFQAALSARPGSPERARFIFREGRGTGGELPPNNWESVFGGPAWTRVTNPDGTPGQWYLHSFDPGQPDFNWRNDEVRHMFTDALRTWFDRGVDGFRIDVAHGLVKHPELPDATPGAENPYMFDQDEVHDIYRDWRALADNHPSGPHYLVGEVWVADARRLAAYVRPDELDQVFCFDLLVQPWNGAYLRRAIEEELARTQLVGTVPAWVLANHDVHRTVTRYGQEQYLGDVDPSDMIAGARRLGAPDLELGTRRARAAIMLLLALPGTAYVYQGEELGLPEVFDIPDAARQDPIWIRSQGAELGRDGCRVPLPWQDGPTFGFSPQDAAGTPWLPQPESFGAYTVEKEEQDPGSMLHHYRAALAGRRTWWETMPGDVTWIDTGRDDVLALRRGTSTVVLNAGTHGVQIRPEWGQVTLASGPDQGGELPPDTAIWLTGAEPPVR